MVAALESIDRPGHVVLHDVSWRFYEQLCEEFDDRPIHITYDDGNLEIMAPVSVMHEIWKKRIAQLIESACVELGIEPLPCGAANFQRKDLAKGLAPDECYYIKHAPNILRLKRKLDLKKDPPPDLAIEVEYTRSAIPRQPIYAALGVPELWRFDGNKLTVLKLASSGEYKPVKLSGIFPSIPISDFERFMKGFDSQTYVTNVLEFREWVRTLQ